MSPEVGKSIDLLETLVGFDTTSHLTNLNLIDWADDYFKSYGGRTIRDISPCGTKANLIASFGPDRPGGIVLSGHSDVVPVVDQPWTTEPFALTAQDDKLFGRGTADMKGFLACAMAMVPHFAGADLKFPVHIAMTYDEEVGCLGIRSLIPVLREHIAPPRLVVIGEPTSMQVATSHKGQHVYRTTITGKAAHSSRTMDGVNAVMMAARLITFLEDEAEKARSGQRDEAFDPPYDTINVGPIRGGSAFNIVADFAEFDWDHRPIPALDGSELLHRFEEKIRILDADMKAKDPSLGIKHERWAHLLPLVAKPGSDGEVLAKHLANRNDTTVVAFGTEAGFIQQGLDWPVVVCGPGDIAQAHQADEFIARSELSACLTFLEKVKAALI